MNVPAPYVYLVVEKFNSKTKFDFMVSNVYWSEGPASEEARRVIYPNGPTYHRTEVYKVQVPAKGAEGYCRMVLAFERDPETGVARQVYEDQGSFRKQQ